MTTRCHHNAPRAGTVATFILVVVATMCAGIASGWAEEQPEDQSADDQTPECRLHADCPDEMFCFDGRCTSMSAGEEAQTANPLLDDGGADRACGADRRCRLERLKARNRLRRHHDAAEEEQAVREAVDEIHEQETEDINRREMPYSVAFQYHTYGVGVAAGYTFWDHLRADVSLVYDGQRIQYSPDRDDVADLSGSHEVTFPGVHLSYLPSRAWFTPLVSAGFAIGSGDFTGSNRPGVRYHLVTAAVGAEAQFDRGFVMRLAYRHGRLLYNQAHHGPGEYDDDVREGLREFMHDEGLGGFDFSIGWAF